VHSANKHRQSVATAAVAIQPVTQCVSKGLDRAV
jgi:hypothetical protein